MKRQRDAGRVIRLLRGWGVAAFLLLWAVAAAAEPLQVAVSIVPQRYFVQKIAGDLVRVVVMVPPGASPATYEPKPRQMMQLSRAVLYFSVGVPFERTWLPKFRRLNPAMEIVATDGAIRKRPFADDPVAGPAAVGGGDERQGSDPHVWLAPPLVLLQARQMARALARVDVAHRHRYLQGYLDFSREIVELDGRLWRLFGDLGARRTFLVYHPSWGYFARCYGLRQWSLERAGKGPRAGRLSQLVQEARKRRIGVVFVEPQFALRSAQVLATAIGARVETLDPLAAAWSDNLMQVGRKIHAALVE